MKKNIVFDRKKDFDTRGFTLVELLAVISILSIVLTVVIFISINVLDNAKEESYKVTINNVEKIAGDYVLEYNNIIRWVGGITPNYDYQCINVQELIDAGYFKSDILDSHISDSELVKADDYVYIERDGTTKSLTKNILLTGDIKNKYSGLCTNIKTDGNISFNVYPIDWAKEKIVKITYNLFNPNSVYDYTYSYIFDGVKNKNNFNNSSMVQEVKVTQQGTVNASIDKGTKNITNASIAVSKIDNVNPYIEVKVVNGKTYSESKDAEIIIKDNDSGFKVGEYEVKYDWSTAGKTCSQLTKKAKIEIKDDNVKQGSVKINVDSFTGLGELYVCALELSDYVGNIYNGVVSSEMYLDNVGPTIAIDDYSGSSTVRGKVTIPLKVSDQNVGVDGNSFVSSDVVVTIGGSTLNNGISLMKVDNNNYNLTIENYDNVGEVKIIINSGNVLDNLGNGNDKVELIPGVNFSNQYMISYDPNGGKGNMNDTTCIYGNNCTLEKNNFSRVGYIFKGWNTEKDGSGTGYSNNHVLQPYNLKTDLTLYAQWKINTVTIKYSVNGGTIQETNSGGTWTTSGDIILRNSSVLTAKINYGESLGSDGLANYNNLNWVNVSKTGHSAVSGAQWKCLSGCSTGGKTYDHAKVYEASDFCDASSENCEVVVGVNWQANTYTVNYSCGTGTGTAPKSQTATYDKTFTVSANTCSKTGYEFAGWNDPTGVSWTDWSGTWKYVNGQYGISNNSLTLTAQWQANTYTVNYSCGTGTGTAPKSQTATYDKTFTVAANTCSKTGYSFTGWNDPTGVSWTGWSGTWKYVNGQYGISDNSLTLTAQWKIDTYSITYDANGGSGAPSAGTKTHDTNYTLSSTKPTRTGYSFVNWNTKADGSGTSYNAGATYKTNAALKLYAQWKADTYSITYDANGGTGAPSAGTKTHDTNYTLSSTKPTRTGYSFVNWNTKKDGSGTSYNAGATYKTNAALKLYAQWKDETAPTITLGTDGTTKWKKSVSSTITVTDNGSGVNTSTLKYIFSTSNTANPTTAFTNGGTVSLNDVSDKYYLRVYACDNAGNCTTKTSKVFKLDNIAPTVTCDNTKAYLMQKLNSDGSENTLSISKTETCTVYAQMITASGGLYSSRWDTLIESDNNSVYDWEYSSKMINEDGSVVDNFQKTKGNCNNGYCSWVFTMEVWDQAGNSASGSFTYKVKY